MLAAPPLATHVPVPATSLVGRQLELQALDAILADDATRCVTLVGPGGIGKTRLALATAAAVAERFEDGVVFVDLSPLTDPSLVLPTIAHAVGLPDSTDGVLVEALVQALKHKQVLLVLDNFEQVLDASPDLDRLLQALPCLRLLVTSRAPLRLEHERVFAVSALSAAEAADLFVQRARATRLDFLQTETNARAIADICTRLDYIPLAIELAASRTRVLSAEQIAERLGERFRLLTAGADDSPARHRTLRAAIDWSYEMLGECERALLRRMSVFAGTSGLDGLEVVAAGGCLEPADLLDALTNLVEHSLLSVEEHGSEARYRLLESVRDYGQERLNEASEFEATRARHAEWCLALAERAEPELLGSRPRPWRDLLERELDNLRAAIAWWIRQADAEPALRLATALWKFCELHGHIAEGQTWFASALAIASNKHVEPSVRGKALHGAAILAGVSGNYERAIALQQENLALWRTLGDQHAVAMSMQHLADVLRSRGDTDRAIPLFRESLELFRSLDDRRMCATILNNLGMALVDCQAFAAARAALEEALAEFRDANCPRQTGSVLDNLGDLARREGKLADAQAYLVESLEIFCMLEDPWNSGICLESLAQVALSQGHSERAARLFGAAERQREIAGAALELADRPDHDRAVAALRIRLGPREMSACWSAGRALSVDAALDVARDATHHAPAPLRISSLATSPLTEREREVAALVARGLTNKQIADALVITKQTADKHVGNILGKLGVASRSQVAVWVVQNALRPVAA